MGSRDDLEAIILEEMTGPDAAASLLQIAPEPLSVAIRERILAMGPEVVPPLTRLVRETLRTPGFHVLPTMRAIALLTDLRAPEAIDALIELYAAVRLSKDFDDLHPRLFHALLSLREASVEPALRALDASSDIEAQQSLASLLANLKIKDERIFQALVERVYRDEGHGALSLMSYGDPRAIPDLQEVLDLMDVPSPPDWFQGRELECLFEALEELGAQLTPAQMRKQAKARRQQEPLEADFLERAREYLRRRPGGT
ncbi:MAG: hypothetical protein HY901_18930 [Deltaproteobacteria bacterium]|nr:hypothetical protein [Deltaproteobacteria bacterium]